MDRNAVPAFGIGVTLEMTATVSAEDYGTELCKPTGKRKTRKFAIEWFATINVTPGIGYTTGSVAEYAVLVKAPCCAAEEEEEKGGW